MADTVYRFMDARMLMNLVAGNWASFETELETDEPFESDGLLAVDIPWVRFTPQRNARSGCRGGLVALDLADLTDGEDFVREGDEVYVMADVLIGEELTIHIQP
jgi:hypothetical protein